MIMKLYELSSKCTVKLLQPCGVPPGGKPLAVGDIVKFQKVDGMYSLCYDKDGNIVHPQAWTEVEIVT